MAVHVQRSNSVPTIERIRSRRQSTERSRSCESAVSIVREVVRRSDSLEGAVSAVKAIDATWSHSASKTCEASRFLLTILELSESVENAVRVVEMLGNDASLLEPLEDVRTFIQTEFPGARLQIAPGDDVVSTCLTALIPAKDYPSFKSGYDRIRNWSVKNHAELGSIIHISPRRLFDDV